MSMSAMRVRRNGNLRPTYVPPVDMSTQENSSEEPWGYEDVRTWGDEGPMSATLSGREGWKALCGFSSGYTNGSREDVCPAGLLQVCYSSVGGRLFPWGRATWRGTDWSDGDLHGFSLDDLRGSTVLWSSATSDATVTATVPAEGEDIQVSYTPGTHPSAYWGSFLRMVGPQRSSVGTRLRGLMPPAWVLPAERMQAAVRTAEEMISSGRLQVSSRDGSRRGKAPSRQGLGRKVGMIV